MGAEAWRGQEERIWPPGGLVTKKCTWGSAHPRVVPQPLLWDDQGKTE